MALQPRPCVLSRIKLGSRKFDMFEISRTALLSELTLFIRLKFLSHSAVLTGNVFIPFMSGFRFLG